MKKGNENLYLAKERKNDEFYTRIEDIQEEIYHYRHHFKGKSVFLNCDNPDESNFVKYFAEQFNILGLSRLVSTYYDKNKRPYKLVIEKDVNGDGKINFDDIEKTLLDGDGDFRSDESIEILKNSDIVVTNPPFSLFREFVSLLEKYDKKFLIIGSQNAITYKDVIRMFMENKIWMGISKPKKFMQPDGTLKDFGNICWYTNLEHRRRNEEMILFREYHGEDSFSYIKYRNFNAIEISKTADIPKDYDGVMGVPISFMDKYNPKQFEILGAELFWNIETSEGIFERPTHELINGREVYKRIWIKNKKPILK